MHWTTRNAAMVAGALLVTLAAPGAARAQHRLAPVEVHPNAKAGEYHAKATILGDSLNRMKQAAKLHEQSAALRTSDDPQLFACLREAALHRYYSGQRSAAVTLMEQAAARAAERGDVINAAQSFSDAAIIAHELKQPARAWDNGVKADVLTGSPLLSDAQRLALRERIVPLDRRSQTVSVNRQTVSGTQPGQP